MLENLENFLEMNAELAWLLILIFAFLESFILSGVIVSAAILFTTCIFIYNAEVLPLYLIVPIAIFWRSLRRCVDLFLEKLLDQIFFQQNL